jgi:hypothetical protein
VTTACLSTNATNTFSLAAAPQVLHIATVSGVATLARGAGGHLERFAPCAGWRSHLGAALRCRDRHPACRPHSRRPGAQHRWRRELAGFLSRRCRAVDLFAARLRCRRQDRAVPRTEPVGLYRSEDGGQSWTDLAAVRTAPMHERWQFPSPDHDPHLKTLTVDPLRCRRGLCRVGAGARCSRPPMAVRPGAISTSSSITITSSTRTSTRSPCAPATRTRW